MRMSARLNMTGLDNLLPNTRLLVSEVVRKTAFDIQATAQTLVPVDTGAAKASIHVVTGDADGYTTATENAQAAYETKYPKQTLDFWPDNPVSPSEDSITALVAVAVLYGWYLENGTPGGRIKGRPFLQPAVDAAQTAFEMAVSQALDEGAQKSGGSYT